MPSPRGAEGGGPVRVTVVLDLAAVGGAEIVLRDTVAHLDPRRVTADVVCLREPGPLAGDLAALGVDVTALERSGRFDLSTVPRLVRHLRRRRTDVVLVCHHHRASLTLGRLAALLSGRAASVVAAHDMDLTRVGRRVLPRYVVSTLFLSRGLALLAPSQGRYLHEQEGVGAGRLSRAPEYLVPNGIPMPDPPPPDRRAADRKEVRAELGVADDDVVVLQVARLSGQKAHEVMIDAIARAAHPRLRLVVVGDGRRRAELEALVAERGLADRITFLGLRRDVPRLLVGGDVFALSSVHEGVPISVIEAMAHGLPVVATDCGALRDLVTEGVDGHLVEVGDATALAERLARLADDPELRAELGARAETRARAEFTIENTAAAFAGMVESVTRRAPRTLVPPKVAWYARRLRSMGPREVADRARTVGVTAARRVVGDAEPDDATLLGRPDPDWSALLADVRAGAGRPVLLETSAAAAVAAAHPRATAELLAAADRVAEHRFTFFAHPEARYPGAVDWSYDPLADVHWPDLPSHAINHRAGHGDPKWIWELNRLQHLPWLAQAWLLTGDERYGRAALDSLDAWIDANPPGRGIAWRGAFEVGVRAISVAVALQGLADHPDLTPERYRRAVRMLAAGARRCWRDRSKHSSANNHLVGELAGLAAVAILVPELASARRWERDAVAALAVEARRQILPDGVGAEQAVGYQVFTAELLAVVALLRRLRPGHAPTPDDAALLAALERSAGHLADLVGTADPTPRTGDDDEGFALRLDPAGAREVRPHLALVAALTGHPAAQRAGSTDLTAAWVGARLGSPAPRPSSWEPGSSHAPQGGLVVLRDGARRVTVDVGPLGYLSIAAHGHADALAVGLAVDGRDLVGDPGTGSYFAHPGWRTAHRGTRAHATVTVDGGDQSVMGGPFLWTEHAGVRVRGVDLAAGRVDAEHDGYRRLVSATTHRRVVVAPPGEDALLVIDLLTSTGGMPHLRTTWPLHPDLALDGGAGVLARRDGVPVLRIATGASTPVTGWRLRGGDPGAGELGWWSDRLEQRRPTWFVGAEVPPGAPGAVVLATVLATRDAAAADLPAPEVLDGPCVRWTGSAGVHETPVDAGRPLVPR